MCPFLSFDFELGMTYKVKESYILEQGHASLQKSLNFWDLRPTANSFVGL